MRFSIPYGDSARQPYWGASTSAVNFCEEDYLVTQYVAEFFNALTSLTYIGYGYLGIKRFKRQNIGLFATANLPYWGLIGIGIASGIYHSTLKYHTQMADEMSMHLAMGCILVQLFTFEQPPEIQRRNATIIVVGLTSFITYHCITDEFVLHVILFVSLCITVTWKTRRIIRESIADEAQKKKLSNLATLASSTFGFAYFIWNIDVHFCQRLTGWKRQIGMPWGILLELHSWWHILTAIAAYTAMAMIEFLTGAEHEESHGIGFLWPAKAVLQELAPRKLVNGEAVSGKFQANGQSNGDIRNQKAKAL